MYDAPTLFTAAGKPDASAAAVLIARAERAGPDGRDTYAGHDEIARVTRLGVSAVKLAEGRLEEAGLLVRDGRSHLGTVRWHLDMTQRQADANQALIDEKKAKKREQDAARQQRARERRKAGNQPLEIEGDVATGVGVTHSECVSHAFSVRDVTQSDAVTSRSQVATNHPVNHPAQPPTTVPGGTLPPGPLRRPSPPPSEKAPHEDDESITEPPSPAQDPVGESLPRASDERAYALWHIRTVLANRKRLRPTG